MLRIATFNLENLFTRPTAMNTATGTTGREAIEHHSELNSIVDKDVYDATDKDRLVELSERYKFHVSNPPRDALVQLQRIRGKLFRMKNGAVEVVAERRGDWTGWFELRRDDIQWEATYNTARVVKETHPDILIVVEAENRPTLKHFCDQVLEAEFEAGYPHLMIIDGNDYRGIDVGIASRFPIAQMESHVDDAGPSGTPVFSRDCPEFDIQLNGKRIVVLPNHLKSKRNGEDEESQVRRTAQAERAHAIALGALGRSELVLIGGDLNDTPDSPALRSLFADGFKDVNDHEHYPKDRPGTYGTGRKDDKLDYLLMSPQLRSHLVDVGVERRGTYHPKLWKSFDTVTTPETEASDHHLVWGDFDL
jgi:endonuclease/exonuclease/phosphatase family metal-dependent hydrolase